MKRSISFLFFAMLMVTSWAQKDSMTEFVNNLMAKMTLQEKLGQLNLVVAGDITTGGAMNTPVGTDIANGRVSGVFNIKGFDKIKALQDIAMKKSRLHIPIVVGMDVIHGYETVFPVPLALSCSWDMEAIEKSAHIAAKESSADGISWTFSPMVDIALDARWGRMCEGGGEDPFLGSCIAAAMVRGFQGDMSRNDNILACLKHFALYGAAEAGRDYNTVDMSRIRMYNQYLPPYKAAVKAGVGSVMSSFNVIDGIPATANKWLLTDLLRKEWGFNGFVVTDYNSIDEMKTHGLGQLDKCSALALQAGTDMDMCSQGFVNSLEKSLQEGKVTMAQIDTACRRVLEAKYKMGLFKDPYKYLNSKRQKTEIFTAENRATARQIATETFVLLKNSNNLLPLQKTGKIALIGPLANTRTNMAGTWSVASVPDKYSTLKEGMERALEGKAQLLYAQGSNLTADATEQTGCEWGNKIPRGDDKVMKAEALQVAKQADVIVCAMGESAEMSGESSSRSSLELPDVQMSLLKELVATGKPVVLLNFAGRATVLTWESKNVNAILNVWFGGSETADAICDVLFGDVNPSGKLTVSMPQTTGQEPLYYNHLPTGRPVADDAERFYNYQSNYLDVRNGALYPFGFGLSYTTFEYGDLSLSSKSMSMDGELSAKVTVKNSGTRDGYEVVQLYLHDREATISRPVIELKGFQRVHLKAGESKEVTFKVIPDMLKYYDSNLNFTCEPGEFDIMVGGDSKNLKKSVFVVE